MLPVVQLIIIGKKQQVQVLLVPGMIQVLTTVFRKQKKYFQRHILVLIYSQPYSSFWDLLPCKRFADPFFLIPLEHTFLNFSGFND